MSEPVINGLIKSAELATNLSDVLLVLVDSSGIEKEKSRSDRNGRWQITGPGPGESLRFSKTGFVTKTFSNSKIPDIIRLLDDRLIGYQNKLWFQPGENVEVQVHSAFRYKAILYRHGVEKLPVIRILDLSSQIQQVPDGYFVDTGIAWEKSFSYLIPENAKPGLYSLMLENDNQEYFAIPMIVSSPYSKVTGNKLLVLASTTTWQAYNIWGGRSRYLNYEIDNDEQSVKKTATSWVKRLYILLVRMVKKLLPNNAILLIRQFFNTRPEKVEPWMFERLSIRRPFTNCDLEVSDWKEPFINHLAGGEWRILAWLEKTGIDYDIVSCWELEYRPEIMKNHKAILFSTHCEYWSCEMFNNVKKYHEKEKLWIINLAGNTMFRQIEHFKDGSLRFVSSLFNKSCSDETKLIGVRFTDLDYGTCAPYKAMDINHWVFSGTNVDSDNNIFGEQSLNRGVFSTDPQTNTGRPAQGGSLTGNGASGWETDKVSITAPGDFKLVAKGMNPDGGADMVVREPSSDRGGVFSASSIVFGGSLGIDSVCSKVVENVLKKCLKE